MTSAHVPLLGLDGGGCPAPATSKLHLSIFLRLRPKRTRWRGSIFGARKMATIRATVNEKPLTPGPVFWAPNRGHFLLQNLGARSIVGRFGNTPLAPAVVGGSSISNRVKQAGWPRKDMLLCAIAEGPMLTSGSRHALYCVVFVTASAAGQRC